MSESTENKGLLIAGVLGRKMTVWCMLGYVREMWWMKGVRYFPSS